MKNTYHELIDQTYHFPQNGFSLVDGTLNFNNVDLHYLIEKYGTPFKLAYLPKIREKIKQSREYFNKAIAENNYSGSYEFCYCTKCCHFNHVVRTALKENVSLETSSSFDIDLIENLYNKGVFSSDKTIVHNGYKTDDYIKKIGRLNKEGFKNSICVLDNARELDQLMELNLDHPIKIGLRISIEEDPKAAYYTSRLGINKREILDFVKERIIGNDQVELVMVHFFVDSGVSDNMYYWNEFKKALNQFTKIKKIAPSVNALNIGGGFPIQNSLSFDFDYEYITGEIVRNIQEACKDENVEEPDIYTEFGKYTVGESGAVIFQVLEQKQQNDAELWYLVDNSLMNTIPDAWSINEKFILLPLNKWENQYKRINIGGISCDHSDYYNSEELNQQVLLPTFSDDDSEPLYIGFFHTGAYQDSISGYGGIKHCLIPSPKHIVVDIDEDGNLFDYVYRDEQTVDNMLNILGYND
ncbi:arginine decarboxylase [Gracilimonas sediminicola]|uniref:Arginine decarboxylase n=1 Tax=Gracilimonas sediminicola TaxID=2952158 RepID=A0A9X2L5D0_9BACT|nr:arginine decarboxylase [Gracilimonas sediminicola]MCP9292637.1 arginine decarboxylase [Gracilimonas sediminicola]